MKIFKKKSKKLVDYTKFPIVHNFIPETSVSILNSDFLNLNKTLLEIKKSNAEWLHYDVMDGHFVHNISFGPKILNDIRKKTDINIGVHLMVSDPVAQYHHFVEYCDLILFHFEATYYREIKNLLLEIKGHKVKSGLAIKPNTNIEQIFEYLEYCDEILIMTVEPGKGGQTFMKNLVPKIEKLSKYLHANNLNKTKISVDGGINIDTAKLCHKYGASKFVMGTYFMNSKNKNNIVKEISLLK